MKLTKRVERARLLRFTPITGSNDFNTWGSKDDHYVVNLISGRAKIYSLGILERTVTAFFTDCNMHTVGADNNPYEIDIRPCRGNSEHTVCYHCIGRIIHAYQGLDKEIQFYEDYNEASALVQSEAGDKLVKIFNSSRRGHIWMVVRNRISSNENFTKTVEFYRIANKLSAIESIDIIKTMRGAEDDEGID